MIAEVRLQLAEIHNRAREGAGLRITVQSNLGGYARPGGALTAFHTH